jgi:hypothetical protein
VRETNAPQATIAFAIQVASVPRRLPILAQQKNGELKSLD